MKLTTLILCTFFLNVAFSQEPRVITFDSEQSKEESSSNSEKNVVKISIFELISGDFPVYYERVLNDKLSVTASIGITFGDYVGGILLDDFNSFDNSVNSKYGLSYSASLRFYPIEMLEEFYIAPEYKYRKFNWEREVFDQNGIEDTYSEYRKYSIPRINIGYSFFYDNQLIFDYFLGIGMNSITEANYKLSDDKVVVDELNRRPRFHVGFKIGYVF